MRSVGGPSGVGQRRSLRVAPCTVVGLTKLFWTMVKQNPDITSIKDRKTDMFLKQHGALLGLRTGSQRHGVGCPRGEDNRKKEL